MENKSMMGDSIKVSVLCFAYNQKTYIKDALDSFISQKTDFPYEIIVHDNGSTDGTAEIIKDYENRFPDRIKPVYEKENQYSKNRNFFEDTAVSAKGQYIALCEGDDYWIDDNKLQKQADFLDKHKKYAACACSTKIVNCMNGRERIYHPVKHSYTLTAEDIILWDQNRYQTSSLMYRNKYGKRPRQLNVKEMGDYPLALWLLHSGGGIYYMKDVMSVYREMAAGSWSRMRSTMNQAEIKKAFVKDVNRMLDFYDDLTDRKYSDYIYAVKRRGETNILSAEGRYKEILWNYQDVWKRYRKRSVLILFIRAYFPQIAKLLEHLKGN